MSMNVTDTINKTILMYDSNTRVLLEVFKLCENILRVSETSKNDFLTLAVDVKITEILKKDKSIVTEMLKKQGEIVLDLLKMKDLVGADGKVVDDGFDFAEELKKRNGFTPQLKKYLTQGKLLTLYESSSNTKLVHFYMTNDLKEVIFKDPKEDFIREDMILPIKYIKELRYGYHKYSPIATSAGFFKKAPPPENCFAIIAKNDKNQGLGFHLRSDTAEDAKNLYNGLKIIAFDPKYLYVKRF